MALVYSLVYGKTRRQLGVSVGVLEELQQNSRRQHSLDQRGRCCFDLDDDRDGDDQCHKNDLKRCEPYELVQDPLALNSQQKGVFPPS